MNCFSHYEKVGIAGIVKNWVATAPIWVAPWGRYYETTFMDASMAKKIIDRDYGN